MNLLQFKSVFGIGADPFRDLDLQLEEENNDPELVNLMEQVLGDDHCSYDACVCEDDSIPTCFDTDNEHWQEEFLSQLGEDPSTMQPSTDNAGNPEDSDVEETLELPPLKITRYDEALCSLEYECFPSEQRTYLRSQSDHGFFKQSHCPTLPVSC